MKTDISIAKKPAVGKRRLSPILLASLAAIAISPAWADAPSDATMTAPAADPTGAGNVWTTPKYAIKEIKQTPPTGSTSQPVSDQSPDQSQGQGQSQGQSQSGNQSQDQQGQTQSQNQAQSTTEVTSQKSQSGIIRRRHHSSSDTATPAAAATPSTAAAAPAFDEKAFRSFVDSLKEPQYVWLSPDRSSAAVDPKNAFKQTKTLANADQLSRMDSYIKDLTNKVQANLVVPSTATLVESTNRNYSYLITFTLRERGQMANFQVEKQLGPFTTEALADDNESAAVVSAINKALTSASPMPTPPVGFAPWYMVMKYDVNSGRIILACLNSR
jgi:hypothetical protein